MALTDAKVRAAKPLDKSYKLTDGDGMHLMVHTNGSKYWRLQYRFGEESQPITEEQVLQPRLWEDKKDDLWTVYQRLQENLVKGGLSGRNAKGKRARTRSVNGIEGDIKLNKALWVMTEKMYEHFSRRD
ncbi:integrase arm-type DNA-binding domain-containing protein [Providencia rettgeri]|uniref:integrase arm-type DNA-binding domain-containing protein n=1 Tax=Providencia rettgeri TaxID=587 RepID=UPI00300FA664